MKCPVCQEEIEPKLVETYTDSIAGGEYKIYICPVCEVQFSDPMKNPGPGWYEKCEFYDEAENPSTEKLNYRMAPFFDLKLTKGLKLLDVGCGFGNFLRAARSAGFICTGIDFSPRQIALAKERLNLNDVHVVSLEDFVKKEKSRKFDIITLFGTLEHHNAPSMLIDLASSMLSPGGYLTVNVPNDNRPIFFNRRERWDYPPHHLTRWSAVSLVSFLKNKGFDVIVYKDSFIPVRHIYNQLLGIPLDVLIKKTVSALKSKFFAARVNSSDTPLHKLISEDDGHNMMLKGLLKYKNVYRIPIKMIRFAAQLFSFPVTMPIAIYYKIKGHSGCEIFCLVRVRQKNESQEDGRMSALF